MLLQLKWQYLQRTIPGVGSLMGPIEDALREALLPALFRGEEVSAKLKEILGHSVKKRDLDIQNPRLLEECAYNTFKSAIEVLLGSRVGGTDLNYVARKGCVCRASVDRWKKWEFSETKSLMMQKDLADRAVLNFLWKAT